MTVDALVGRYRAAAQAEAAGPSARSLELEVRMAMPPAMFAALHGSVAALFGGDGAGAGGFAPAGEPSASQSIDVIVTHEKNRKKTTYQLPLVDGARQPGARTKVVKTVKGTEFVTGPLDYRVSLATEEPAPYTDPGVYDLVRFRARATFPVADASAPDAAWRVDMTIVRTVPRINSAADMSFESDLFRRGAPHGASVGKMTAANLLEYTDLADAPPEVANQYSYEVEAEYAGTPAALSGDAVRRVAAFLVGLARPAHVAQARLRDELLRVAQAAAPPAMLAKFREGGTLSMLAPKPVALSRDEWQKIFPPVGWLVTDKADGVRALASVHDGALHVITAAGVTTHTIPAEAAHDLTPPERLCVGNDTVVDAELVVRDGVPTLFAFDAVVVKGANVSADGFEARVERLPAALEALAVFAAHAVPPVRAVAKPFVRVDSGSPADLRAAFTSVVDAPRPYETDGIILYAPDQPWFRALIYKWKPADENTIDFLARAAPASVVGLQPIVARPRHTAHLLFAGITRELADFLRLAPCPGYKDLFPGGSRGNLVPMQFSPATAPYAYVYYHPASPPAGWKGGAWPADIDGLICEFRCPGECAAAGGPGPGGDPIVPWELVRVREDKSAEGDNFGNFYRVAELTWLNYVDPFPIEFLFDGPSDVYFQQAKTGLHKPQINYNNVVKWHLLREHTEFAEWVLDLGAGKGQDLGRHIEHKVRNLVAVDPDRAAIAEIVRRRYQLAPAGGRGNARGPRAASGSALRLFTLVGSADGDPAANAEALRAFGVPAAGFDRVVMNMMIHYVMGSEAQLARAVSLVAQVTSVGALVLITCMLGERVHALLKEHGVAPGKAWTVTAGDTVKFSIRRDYAADELTAIGQRVALVLPFSRGQYYEENLVNTATLTRAFARAGFEPVFVKGFDEFRDLAAQRMKPQNFAALSPDDLAYVSLYGAVLLKRTSHGEAGAPDSKKPAKRAPKKAAAKKGKAPAQ